LNSGEFKTVRLVKITSQYVYVTSDVRGHVFTGFNAEPILKGSVEGLVRIKIDHSVYKTFVSNYKVTVFRTPPICCLTAYDGVIIDIELKLNYFLIEDDNTWAGQFQQNLPKVMDAIKNQQSYINGLQIFWIPKESWADARPMSQGDAFQMVDAEYIGLSRATHSLRVKREDDEKKRSFLKVSKGQVIVYSPDGQVKSFSPVISSGFFFAVSEEERNGYLINSKHNPAYTTLEFVLNAAQTIGQLYGHAANDFLNIPRIIQDFGQVNLTKIDPIIRATSPVHLMGVDALAWLMGFMYRETQLDSQRELVKMFRKIMRTGLIYKNKIEGFYQRDVRGIDDVPLVSCHNCT